MVRALPDSREQILNICETACILGEIEFITDQPYVSSVVALKKSFVICFPVAACKKELLQDAGFLYQIGRRLAMHILSIQKDGCFSLELGTLADFLGTSYRHLLRVINQMISEGLIERDFRSAAYRILNLQEVETCAYL